MDEIVKATLEWCNERRAEKGMEPLTDLPLGIRADMESCPCGKATGLEVGCLSYFYAEHGKLRIRELPEAVKLFTKLFDSGKYPQYDEMKVGVGNGA